MKTTTAVLVALGAVGLTHAFPQMQAYGAGSAGAVAPTGYAAPTGGKHWGHHQHNSTSASAVVSTVTSVSTTTVLSVSTATVTLPASTVTVTAVADCAAASSSVATAVASSDSNTASAQAAQATTTTAASYVAPKQAAAAADASTSSSGQQAGSTTPSGSTTDASASTDQEGDCSEDSTADSSSTSSSAPAAQATSSYGAAAAPYGNSTSAMKASGSYSNATTIDATSDNTTTSDLGNGCQSYSYSKIPAGITLHKNPQDLGFLKKTTGCPTMQAPQPQDAVPADAALYTPPSTTWNTTDFNQWHENVRNKKQGGSKNWLKVAPGTYEITDGSGEPGANGSAMTFGFFTGSWTLDLRGCTFVTTQTADDTKIAAELLYLNQNGNDANTPDGGFTLLGGTYWHDSGVEMFSQAKVISVVPDPQSFDAGQVKATLQIEDGYDYDFWKNAGPRNLRAIDTSDPEHYKYISVNFWYMSGFTMTSNRQATASFGSRAGLKNGYVLTIQNGGNSPAAISSEFNSGLVIRGFTSNAVLFQYGLQDNFASMVVEDSLITHLPAMQGVAPRVYGPTMTWGNLGSANFDAGGNQPIVYKNSYWQYTGEPNDLTSMENYSVPADDFVNPGTY